MSIGSRRHRVEIQRSVTIKDEFGGTHQSWATLITVWADVEETGGKKYMQGDRLKAQRTLKITHRYWPGLSVIHRYLEGARAYNINSLINPDGRKIDHQAECIEELSTTEEESV